MTEAMKKFNTTFNKYRIPGCQDLEFLSDEYWACQARHISLTIYHPVGTAKMGPDSDPMAVVDARLKVKGKPITEISIELDIPRREIFAGVKNLRVVDCSIMPYITSGNTNAPVIMIAEKASDMIKEDWGALDGYVDSSEEEEDEEEGTSELLQEGKPRGEENVAFWEF